MFLFLFFFIWESVLSLINKYTDLQHIIFEEKIIRDHSFCFIRKIEEIEAMKARLLKKNETEKKNYFLLPNSFLFL